MAFVNLKSTLVIDLCNHKIMNCQGRIDTLRAFIDKDWEITQHVKLFWVFKGKLTNEDKYWKYMLEYLKIQANELKIYKITQLRILA